MQKEARERAKNPGWTTLKKLLFQVAWQPFPFVPVAQGMFTLVEQIREGLEMYCICTSSNALGYGAKEKMKFYSLHSWSRKG